MFAAFGYLFGRRVAGRRRAWGLLLAAPAVALALDTVTRIGWESLLQGQGSSHLAAAVVILFAACLGMYVRTRSRHKHAAVEQLLE